MKTFAIILTLIIIQKTQTLLKRTSSQKTGRRLGLISFFQNLSKTKKEQRALSEQLFAKINTYRLSQNLPVVKWDDNVYNLTKDHSGYQRNNEKISHDNAESRTKKYAEAVENVGYTKKHKIENVVEQIFQGWKNSNSHDRNMLNQFKKKNEHGGKADVYGAVSVISNKDDSLMYATMVFVTKDRNSPGSTVRGCF